MEKIQRRAANP